MTDRSRPGEEGTPRGGPAPASLTYARGDTAAGTDVLRLCGALDLATAPVLHTALHEPDTKPRDVVLDVGGLAFVDVTGVRALIEATDTARATGARLTITAGNAFLERLVDLMRVRDRLALVDPSDPRFPGPAAG